MLTEEDAERLGAVAKCAPPLRPATEPEALWSALQDGRVAMVASDHSPSPPSMKAGHAFAAWGGIAGAQTTLPLVLGAGRLAVARVAEVLAGFPARRLRLPGKGRLEPGADADLVLVDRTRWTLRAQDLHQRHPVSPFAGRELGARVVRTVLRGRTVFADGAVTGEPGGGRLVRPAPSAP